jgi:hypothetical protein
MMTLRSGVVLGLAGMLAACSAGETDKGLRTVTQADMEAAGKKWPLSASEGQVGCTDGFDVHTRQETDAYWIQIGDEKYGLNGWASTAAGYADLEPIWRMDGEANEKMVALVGPTAKGKVHNRISISDLQTEAAKQCSSGPHADGKEPVVSAPASSDPERGLVREEMMAKATAALDEGRPAVAVRIIAKNTDANSRAEPEVAALLGRARTGLVAAHGEKQASETMTSNLSPGAWE